MSEALLMGVDVGTTGAKAAIFDQRGRLLALGRSEYGVRRIRPGWAEQDPEDWWRAVCDSVREALAAVPQGPARVGGVAVSSQAPTMLPLGGDGRPVRPALIWMDRRADGEALLLAEALGWKEIERVTGNRPDPFYVAPKLLWFRTHEPEKFANTTTFVQANGYINWRLTGVHSMDEVHASLLQLFDRRTGEWSPELCEACGVTPEAFPPARPCHETLGEVTAEAAEATGLRKGTPVMVGTVDGAAAAMEAGAVEPGVAAEMTGTSTVLLIPNRDGIVEPALIAMPHAVPGVDLLLGATAASGANLNWFRDRFGAIESEAAKKLGLDVFDLLELEASGVPAGSGGVVFLPYMAGERAPIWHTNARGAFFGLSLETSRGGLIRAILEGTAFALRHNVQVAEGAGAKVREVRSVGGGTRSALWNQIKADVLGVPVLLPEAAVGAPFGDAVLAGMGLGIYPDPEETLRDLVCLRARYEPNVDHRALYDGLYGVFRNIYEHVREDFDVLARVEASNQEKGAT